MLQSNVNRRGREAVVTSAVDDVKEIHSLSSSRRVMTKLARVMVVTRSKKLGSTRTSARSKTSVAIVRRRFSTAAPRWPTGDGLRRQLFVSREDEAPAEPRAAKDVRWCPVFWEGKAPAEPRAAVRPARASDWQRAARTEPRPPWKTGVGPSHWPCAARQEPRPPGSMGARHARRSARQRWDTPSPGRNAADLSHTGRCGSSHTASHEHQ